MDTDVIYLGRQFLSTAVQLLQQFTSTLTSHLLPLKTSAACGVCNCDCRFDFLSCPMLLSQEQTEQLRKGPHLTDCAMWARLIKTNWKTQKVLHVKVTILMLCNRAFTNK